MVAVLEHDNGSGCLPVTNEIQSWQNIAAYNRQFPRKVKHPRPSQARRFFSFIFVVKMTTT
jgi:hypothetical protein